MLNNGQSITTLCRLIIEAEDTGDQAARSLYIATLLAFVDENVPDEIMASAKRLAAANNMFEDAKPTTDEHRTN
jgi:hypothetical protein